VCLSLQEIRKRNRNRYFLATINCPQKHIDRDSHGNARIIAEMFAILTPKKKKQLDVATATKVFSGPSKVRSRIVYHPFH